MVSIGASGVISVIANVMPGEFSSMLHLALEGEYGEARQIHLQLGEMFKALFEEGNPAGIKAALHARGVIACQKLRSPLSEVSEALYQKIKRLGERSPNRYDPVESGATVFFYIPCIDIDR